MAANTSYRKYFGEAGQQIHFRCWPAANTDACNAPILLLPPAPHSSKFFETAAQNMAQRHHVYAADYPGYGGSDGRNGASIESYAKALTPFLKDKGAAHLIGFHTGCLVAAEIALQSPQLCAQILMIDVPFFTQETRLKYAQGLGPNGVPSDVMAGFEKSVRKRPKAISHQRAFELWVENLRSSSRRNEAFRAAFDYDCQTKFAAVKHHITVIGTDSSLFELSKQAAQALPSAKFIDFSRYTSPAFEQADGQIGKDILDLLSGPAK